MALHLLSALRSQHFNPIAVDFSGLFRPDGGGGQVAVGFEHSAILLLVVALSSQLFADRGLPWVGSQRICISGRPGGFGPFSCFLYFLTFGIGRK
jgi:hypothetical protein